MSSVIARSVASTPERTASDTWEEIVRILEPDPTSEARAELAKAAGVACSSIASEATENSPIVMWGGGPRVRVYCVFGDDAVTGDGVNEDPLPRSATDGDWKLSIPCLPEDVPWCRKKLEHVSDRLFARSVDDDVDEDTDTEASARSLTINAEEFLKP